MISLEQILNICAFKIVSGERFQWLCYGGGARYLVLESDNATVDVIFDAKTQTVYEAQVLTHADADNFAAYLLLNPAFRTKYMNECRSRNVDPMIAYDDMQFIEIEDEQDFLNKLDGVFNDKEFERRIVVNLTLSNSEKANLEQMATTLMISVDELVERILQEAIPKE